MTTTPVQPFRQIIRINTLRVSALLMLPLVLIVHPALAETLAGEAMEQAGILLVVAGVLGRFWSILYIGGHKNRTVVRSGPYSMCRHPLYLSSTIGALGFGLLLESASLAVALTALTFAILMATARREEAYLRQEFGPAYDAYAAVTPAILPDISRFETEDQVTFSPARLRVNFADALVFLGLIPLAELIEGARDSGMLPALLLP